MRRGFESPWGRQSVRNPYGKRDGTGSPCQHLYGREYDGVDRMLDVRISHLRKKLGEDADSSERIKTIWGQGYLFVPDAW
jgi:hypothetical protein